MAYIIKQKPTKLTDVFQKQLCGLLRDGAPLTVASGLMQVDYQTINSWIVSGKDPNNPCHEFNLAVGAALAENANEAIQQWRNINKNTNDFRSVAGYLGVIHRISAPSKVEISGEVNHTHTLERPDFSHLTPTELQRYLENEAANERLLADRAAKTQRMIETGEIIDVLAEELED